MRRIARVSTGVARAGPLMASSLQPVVPKVMVVCCAAGEWHSLGLSGSLFVWDVKDGTLAKQLGSESSATISCVAWNPDGASLLATDRKSKLITFA